MLLTDTIPIRPQIELKMEALDSFPFPANVKSTFAQMVSDPSTTCLIQRVSDLSFVASSPGTFHTPLCLVHIHFDRKKQFWCQCSHFRHTTSLASSTTAPKLSKRCIHLYLCIWAFLSSQSLREEFAPCLKKFGGLHAAILTSLHTCII